jgi:diketogulonate reductase-like aldo/keto reductase
MSNFDLSDGISSRVTLADGQHMPVLGLGVWKSAPGAETRDAVAHALRVGYRAVDTAAMYRNESDVGEAIRASKIPRDELFVTTKVWNDDQGYDATLRAFDRSSHALGVGVIDLYLVHWPVSGKRSETWRALRHLQKEGKCQSIGVSNYTVPHLEGLLAESEVAPVINQVEFNAFLFQRELLDYCRAHRIQLEAYAPLVRGQRMEDPILKRIASAHGRSPAQVLLRWGLQHEVVQIPKSVHAERIEENTRIFDFALSPAELAELDAIPIQPRTSWDPSQMP